MVKARTPGKPITLENDKSFWMIRTNLPNLQLRDSDHLSPI